MAIRGRCSLIPVVSHRSAASCGLWGQQTAHGCVTPAADFDKNVPIAANV
jgi:hypothetical protein